MSCSKLPNAKNPPRAIWSGPFAGMRVQELVRSSCFCFCFCSFFCFSRARSPHFTRPPPPASRQRSLLLPLFYLPVLCRDASPSLSGARSACAGRISDEERREEEKKEKEKQVKSRSHIRFFFFLHFVFNPDQTPRSPRNASSGPASSLRAPSPKRPPRRPPAGT